MRWAGFSSELDQVSFSDLGRTVLSLERDNDMLWSTVQSKWLPHFQRRLQVSRRAGMEEEHMYRKGAPVFLSRVTARLYRLYCCLDCILGGRGLVAMRQDVKSSLPSHLYCCCFVKN